MEDPKEAENQMNCAFWFFVGILVACLLFWMVSLNVH